MNSNIRALQTALIKGCINFFMLAVVATSANAATTALGPCTSSSCTYLVSVPTSTDYAVTGYNVSCSSNQGAYVSISCTPQIPQNEDNTSQIAATPGNPSGVALSFTQGTGAVLNVNITTNCYSGSGSCISGNTGCGNLTLDDLAWCP